MFPVQSISITNMLNHRNATIACMQAARAELFKANAICKAENINLAHVMYSLHDYVNHQLLQPDTASNSFISDFIKRLDAQLWQRLMHESGLRTFMDSKARDEWDKAIMNVKTPELTIENIEATFEQLYNSRSEMFERGVIEVFKGLSWDYKSNLPHKIGKRIVARCFMDSYGVINGYARADKLSDLERCMYILDGKPEPDHRLGIVQKCGEVQRTRMGYHREKNKPFEIPDRIAEDDYFRVKWYKNGNGHFYFKRPDLLDKMNLIIAKHYPSALPPVKD